MVITKYNNIQKKMCKIYLSQYIEKLLHACAREKIEARHKLQKQIYCPHFIEENNDKFKHFCQLRQGISLKFSISH